MVVAHKMNKSTLKISVSDTDSSSGEESEEVMDIDETEADAESITSDKSDGREESTLITNEGWGDSIVKILGSSKPKNKKTLVLSRAKKYSETAKAVKEHKPEFEVIGEDVKPAVEEVTNVERPRKTKKQEKPLIRVKPNILEKDRERLLNKIATKGVVQLFNAVRNQQKTLEREIDRNDVSESKKEKILKKFDKRAFLDTLMGQTKSIVVDEENKTLKNELKNEDDKPKWSALRDDFMMGAKMKDWDKESVDE